MRLSDLIDLAAETAGPEDRVLAAIEARLAEYGVGAVPADELDREFQALVRLYRAVREMDRSLQRQARRSDVGEQLSHVYYRLRSVHGGLAARYAAGEGAQRPDLSPLGTAIGLYDLARIVAQATHLETGSYDGQLPWFTGWMLEIWEDLEVRRPDYAAFYNRRDPRDSQRALARILGLDDEGRPRPLDLGPGGRDDPAALIAWLEAYAASPRDLADAARAIQEAAHQARRLLVWLLARRPELNGSPAVPRLREADSEPTDSARLRASEEVLYRVLHWRFPVGETPLLDLEAEQQTLDLLLASVTDGMLPPSRLHAAALAALERACLAEQSLRDHREEYAARGQTRRSFRWYIWELLRLVDQATASVGGLGARQRMASPDGP